VAVEAGERVQGLLLAAEEQLRLVGTIGIEADERAALEGDFAGDDRPFEDLLEQGRGGRAPVPFQGVPWNSRTKAGSASGGVPSRRIG
jgi:hypothetical protein